MSNDYIKISQKFRPLFKLLNNDWHPEIDTVIITGGRYSLKSYSVSILSLIALVEYEWNILYTRFTNSTIVDSVKPEVSDKIELLGYTSIVKDTDSHIEHEGNRISFKGIKPGQKSQTANLKSLSGFNCFVNDEAEELPDYKTFKKIFYSIRSTDKRNLTILILNPTVKSHWIFEEFFEKKKLEGGENCIVDNVMYIHTSYLDCDFNMMPKNILADYEKMKVEDEKEYDNIVIGGWLDNPEGVLLPKSKLNFNEIVNIESQYNFAICDPADKGGDKMAAIFCSVLVYDRKICVFVIDVIHNTLGIEVNNEYIIERLTKYCIEDVYCESNGVGLAAVILLKRTIQTLKLSTKLHPFPSTENKEVRILSNYEFVRDNFIFDKLYKNNDFYHTFVQDLSGYIIDGKNDHKKDAIDVCCMASALIKAKYKSILYGLNGRN